ncbi:MAG TPA: outer membrane protein [Xanthobacteraceae bacterium]|nr:outer membrane protein [Xanthobacteraceae bacterium]
MKRIVLGAAVAALAAAAAGAADLPPAPPVTKAPVVAPLAAYDWTGFYVGINGGGAWGQSSFDGATGTLGNFGTSGWLAGATAGYNLQYGHAVFGLEGDIDWTNINGSAACVGGTATCQTQNDWLGTARGRLGYAFDRFLPFVTGGLAVGNINANVPGFGSASNTNLGWTVGGGLEVALGGNWTAKAEYLYVDLGSFSCGTACTGTPSNVDFTTSIVRGGLNFKF